MPETGITGSVYVRSLIEASLDPLVTISPEGKITDMNQAFPKITGLSRESLTGTSFLDYFTDAQMATEVYEKVYKEGFVVDSPLTIRHLDGKLTDVLFNGSVYKDEKGLVRGVVIVARDVTERNRIELENAEARAFAEMATLLAEEAQSKAEQASRIAEKAVRAKQQFLSNMSHEIRTPMNAIIGFTRALQRTDISPRQAEYLGAIKTSGDSLIVLINDILDLAKVDAGKMEFEELPFSLEQSIASMLQLFEGKIREKDLALQSEYDPKIPALMIGDSGRLKQVLMNLLSNAVKFTTKGTITLKVKLHNLEEEQCRIEFLVTDTGIGIPSDRQNKIFELYEQAYTGTSRLYGGTGLGLAIVKQLVEGQKGKISLQSTPGEGSTFGFILDYKKAKEGTILPEDLPFSVKEARHINVLVAEDIPLNQLLMKTMLNDFGFIFDIAGNGKEAIEKLKSHSYDIILMDLQMPEMDGFQATEYIRKTMNSNIPIIALTADVTTIDLGKSKESGFNDYLSKPIDEGLLYSKIISLVKKKSGERIFPAHSHKPGDLKRITELGYLRYLTRADPLIMIDMIALYLEQTPPLVDSMMQCLKDGNHSKLGAAVHKLIPSFTIVGLDPKWVMMANEVLEIGKDPLRYKEIKALVEQIGKVCEDACEELKTELINLQNESNAIKAR